MMTTGSNRRRPRTLDHDPEAVTWARKKAGLTKRELARRIGISAVLMGEIESGWRNATPANLAKIAEALNCPRAVLEHKRTGRPTPSPETDTTHTTGMSNTTSTTTANHGGIPVAVDASPVPDGRTWAITTTNGYTASGPLPAFADDDPSTTGVAPERLSAELTDILHWTAFGGQYMRVCPAALDPGEDSVVLTAHLQCAPYAEEPQRRVPLLNIQIAADLWLINLDPGAALEVADRFEEFVHLLRGTAVPAAVAARTEWAARHPATLPGEPPESEKPSAPPKAAR
jgi:DNA-binding XRE family transcriptional regulator